MAKTVLERCDLIVGQKEGADYFTAIGSYKVEGEEQPRYAAGAYMTLPAKFKTADEDINKALLLAHKRMVSADNAGLPAKIKAGDMTAEEAAAVIMEYDGDGFLVKLNEVKERTAAGPRTDSTETLAIKYLANVLKTKQADGKLADAKVAVPRVDDPPKTEKGQVNFIAWAKVLKEASHPWYGMAYKKVSPAEKGFE